MCRIVHELYNSTDPATKSNQTTNERNTISGDRRSNILPSSERKCSKTVPFYISHSSKTVQTVQGKGRRDNYLFPCPLLPPPLLLLMRNAIPRRYCNRHRHDFPVLYRNCVGRRAGTWRHIAQWCRFRNSQSLDISTVGVEWL